MKGKEALEVGKYSKKDYMNKIKRIYLKNCVLMKQSIDKIDDFYSMLLMEDKLKLLQIPESELQKQWNLFITKMLPNDNIFKAALLVSPPSHSIITKWINKHPKSVKPKNSNTEELREFHSDTDTMDYTPLKRVTRPEIWYKVPGSSYLIYFHENHSNGFTFMQARLTSVKKTFKKNKYNFTKYCEDKGIKLEFYSCGSHLIAHESIINKLFTKNLQKKYYTSFPTIEISNQVYPYWKDFVAKYKETSPIGRKSKYAITNLPEVLISQLEELVETLPDESFISAPIVKKPKLNPNEIGLPFRYTGNSSSYLHIMQDIFMVNSAFQEAKNIYDLTCGSGTITLYFAQLYPNKNFWMNDINPHLMGFFKLIKEDLPAVVATYATLWTKLWASENPKGTFRKLSEEYNAATNKNYAVFFFLQYLSTAITYSPETKNLITSLSYMPYENPEVVEKKLRKTHAILNQGNIFISCQDALEIIKQNASKNVKEDFYILTPPHIKDKSTAYYNLTNIEFLKNFIMLAKQNSNPYIITLGDNSNYRSPNLNALTSSNMIRLTHFAQLRDKTFTEKRLIIYASENSISNEDHARLAMESLSILKSKYNQMLYSLKNQNAYDELFIRENLLIIENEMALLSNAKPSLFIELGYIITFSNLQYFLNLKTTASSEISKPATLSNKQEEEDVNNNQLSENSFENSQDELSYAHLLLALKRGQSLSDMSGSETAEETPEETEEEVEEEKEKQKGLSNSSVPTRQSTLFRYFLPKSSNKRRREDSGDFSESEENEAQAKQQKRS